jgi:hypothetical protein
MPWGRQEVWGSSQELAVWKSVRQGVGERKEERSAVFDITNYDRNIDHQNDRSPVDNVNTLSDGACLLRVRAGLTTPQGRTSMQHRTLVLQLGTAVLTLAASAITLATALRGTRRTPNDDRDAPDAP